MIKHATTIVNQKHTGACQESQDSKPTLPPSLRFTFTSYTRSRQPVCTYVCIQYIACLESLNNGTPLVSYKNTPYLDTTSHLKMLRTIPLLLLLLPLIEAIIINNTIYIISNAERPSLDRPGLSPLGWQRASQCIPSTSVRSPPSPS